MCTKSATRTIVGGIAVLSVLMFAGANASADLPETVLSITAEVGPFEVTIPIPFAWGDYDPQTASWSFNLPEPLQFLADQTFLGQLDSLEVTVYEDPEVNLNFSVQAGASDTTFHIASSLMTFPTITGATGLASAGITVSDSDIDGATLTKKPTLNGSYLAQYNGWAGAPTGPLGTTFHEGIPSVNVAPFTGSNSASTSVGSTAIGAPVSSMSTLFAFQLSATDFASGTSHFEIVPEPASLLLIGIGAVALLRRR